MTLYVAGSVRFPDGGTLYEASGEWIAEVDLREQDITTEQPAEYIRSQLRFEKVQREKSQAAQEREATFWPAYLEQERKKGKTPFDGPLISLYNIEAGLPLRVKTSKSGYREHHAACPLGGKKDEYTKRFFPYRFRMEGDIAIAEIPFREDLFPSLALSTILETGDGKLVYLIRGRTDQYDGVPSLPSGGRMSGDPHQALDDMIADPRTIFDHMAGTVIQEFPGLKSERIVFQQITGAQRSLGDLDTQFSLFVRVDTSAEELERLFSHKKYTDMRTVSATADGMRDLLQVRFPSTVLPVIVYASDQFGVNPQDVLPGLTIIG